MKVALVIPSFYPATVYGGSIFASYYLTKEAAHQGLDIRVLTTNANGKKRLKIVSNKFVDLDGFKVKYFHEQFIKYFSFRLLFGLWKDIKSTDILHLQAIFSYPTPIALLLAFFFNKKVLLSSRGSLSKYSFQKGSLMKKIWLNLLIKPFVKKVYWHATSTKEKSEIKMLFPNAKVYLISDGTYVEKMKHIKKENYIAALGRLHPVKGYDLLIESFVKIHNQYPELHLKIAGKDDGCKVALEELVQNHGLTSKVSFIGSVSGEDKELFLRKAKCLVMPSHTENFGIVAVEAMAQGTPVIASKNTPWEIIEERKAGFWSENNPIDLQKSIERLLEMKIGEYEKNAHSLAKEYDWRHIAKLYQQVLENIYNE
ncbi:MAG: hypothetical protein CMP66_01300 [Flavobacteriales bacterium]|nr:hypothetical protein [Flavobacteriales bacterium]